jgi:hypothetical protein
MVHFLSGGGAPPGGVQVDMIGPGPDEGNSHVPGEGNVTKDARFI